MIGRNVARVAVFSVAVGAASACNLSLVLLDAGQGAGLEAGVVLRSPSGPVSALQFEIGADPGVLQAGYSPGVLLRASSKTLDSAGLAPGRTRFVVSGMNGSVIPDGVLVHLAISYVSSPVAGRLPLSLSNQSCSSPAGDEVGGSSSGDVAAPPPVEIASRLRPDGVRNAASLAAGPVAPGAAVTLLGDDLGTAPEVYFDDYAAIVLYASSSQVNVVVPRQLRPPGASLRIFSTGELRAVAALAVVDLAPGLFTADASGSGAALAYNESGRPNSESEPAPPGSTLTVFLTGADPGVQYDAFIDGIAAEVREASEVAGSNGSVVAVRLALPSAAPDNPRAPLVLRAGGSSAQSGVFVSIGGR